MVETTTFPAGIIMEESVRGYKMGDRTIRAARVKVAKPLEKSNNSQE
jgi:molecular chaperone GrpE